MGSDGDVQFTEVYVQLDITWAVTAMFSLLKCRFNLR